MSVIVKARLPESGLGYYADEKTDGQIIVNKLDTIIRLLIKIEAKLNEDGLEE